MEPALIANIEFKRPKRPKLASSVSKNVQKEGRLATGNAVIQPEAEAKFLSNLKDVFPSAVVFSLILQKPTPCVQSQPVVQKLPFLLTSLHKWGIENEQNAREQYFGQIKDDHSELSCTLSGLCVNPKYPHLGATPDGIVKCDCCGNGLIEIKCPYKHKESHPHSVVDNKYCLEHVDGLVRLKKTHEYYYQIQGQLAICEWNIVTLSVGLLMEYTLNVSFPIHSLKLSSQLLIHSL